MSLYLGKKFNPSGKTLGGIFEYDSKNLTTHAVCVGMTGSGKTGLGIAVLEEIALSGLPAIAIDPKGDLGNLLLTFPFLSPAEFQPWVDQLEAERKKISVEAYAEVVANTWKEGLQAWGEDGARIAKLKNSVEMSIYTPASQAGIPLSILNSLAAPSKELLLDPEAFKGRVLSTTSSLLGLVGLEADPIQSPEHILISSLFDRAWREGKDLKLPLLIHQIQNPPFDKLGALDIETYFPAKERLKLAMSLNHLLASPSFQAWMEGEPLDIQKLLYTAAGTPKLAIISISHLADSERMFFVTLLLNELVGWMRRQPGTPFLRALLYMDEIFGYFPPVANPPSKTPMLTLLKQARAYGLGLMLATQNPVDLDYRGLANCGTWFIGKLQTEQDKAKILEGLSLASIETAKEGNISRLISSIESRVFLLRSVYFPEPFLFTTRWTMSYLRGPLTLPQIQKLMKGAYVKQETSATMAESIKAQAPIGIQEYYAPPPQSLEPFVFHPKLLSIGKLRFNDPKLKVDAWHHVAYAFPVQSGGSGIDWESGEDVNFKLTRFLKVPPASGRYTELPALLMQAKNYERFNKEFKDYLYQTKTFDLLISTDPKMVSNPNESESDFKKRVKDAKLQLIEADEKNIRDDYESKLNALQERIRKAQYKVESRQAEIGRRRFDTWISIGKTILSVFFGKRVTKGSVSDVGTSIRKAGRISKDQETAAEAEESFNVLIKQKEDLQSKMEAEIAGLRASCNENRIFLDKVQIRPKKSDIVVEEIALAWMPEVK